MTDGNLSRGPAITALAMRSGLNTNHTSELRQDQLDGFVDVRLAASRDPSRLLAGRGEHLVAFGYDAGLCSGQDITISSLRLFAERLNQIERGPPCLSQSRLPLPLRGLFR